MLRDVSACLCPCSRDWRAAAADCDGDELPSVVDETGHPFLDAALQSVVTAPWPATPAAACSLLRRKGVELRAVAASSPGPADSAARNAAISSMVASPRGSLRDDRQLWSDATGSNSQQALYHREHTRMFCDEELEEELEKSRTDDLSTEDPELKDVSLASKVAMLGKLKSKTKQVRQEFDAKPGHAAKVRGVQVSRAFDYYSTADKSRQVRWMCSKMVHCPRVIEVSCAFGHMNLEGLKGTPKDNATILDSGGERNATPRPDYVRQRSAQEGDSPRIPVVRTEGHTATWSPQAQRAAPLKAKHRRSMNRGVATMWVVFAAHLLKRFGHDPACLSRCARDFMRLKDSLGVAKISVLASVQDRAVRVVNQAEQLAKRIAMECTDRLDSEWTDENLIQTLFGVHYADNLMILVDAARKVFEAQPVLVETASPARVFGDTHGQLRDVLLLFQAYGAPRPGQENSVYVFNGDFVDRGAHQLELVGILLAMKVLMPTRVWLVRGNHEDRQMNERYGFKSECLRHLGEVFGTRIFDLFQTAFSQMPLACIIDRKILCVHGGIGDGKWTLDDLRRVQRPLSEEALLDPKNAWLLHILWSDPIPDSCAASKALFGVHESPRGSFATKFAWNVTKEFCALNGLGLIVRSHQCTRDGYGFDLMHDRLLMRVFSGRDYEGHGNDSGTLLIQPSDDRTMITVRAQVLQSLTKARNHEWEESSSVSPGCGSSSSDNASSAPSSMTPRKHGPKAKQRGRRLRRA